MGVACAASEAVRSPPTDRTAAVVGVASTACSALPSLPVDRTDAAASVACTASEAGPSLPADRTAAAVGLLSGEPQAEGLLEVFVIILSRRNGWPGSSYAA